MDDRNEMPPIDEELHRAMEDLLRKQVPCRRVHFLLIFLSVVCFWNVVGVTALFANVLVAAFWGNRLSRKGESLARQAYPWLEGIPFLFGWGRGGRLLGISAYERIQTEAKKTGDTLTVRLLRFRGQNFLCPFWGMAGYLTALRAFAMMGLLFCWGGGVPRPGHLPRRGRLWAVPFAKLLFIKEVSPWNFSKRKS